MDIKPLNRDFAISPQIDLADLPAIAAQGYKAIICNRPDNEEKGQIAATELREAAERLGLGSGLTDQSQKMTVAARAMAEKKALGHRS